MSETVSAAETALYCFLFSGSIFFFAITLLSCGPHFSESKAGPHLVAGAFLRTNRCHPTAQIVCLPCVVCGVCDCLLSVWGDPYRKFNSFTIRLSVGIGLGRNVPSNPTGQVLHNTHVHRLLLVITHFDFERLVNSLPIGIEPVVGTT